MKMESLMTSTIMLMLAGAALACATAPTGSVVRAAIRVDGKLMLTTDTTYPVLTHGAGDEVELVLRGVGQR